ncbi:MAG: hypothetical protein LBJ18_02590, partial [Rickettsiales bacterium]|nr:hypothetical protein [Rickettsiales bacterium]
MERARRILFWLFVLLWAAFTTLHAEEFHGYHFGSGPYNISQNTTVFAGATVAFPSIHITDSVSLQNMGVILSPIFIDPGNQLNFQNSGVAGDIFIGENSTLTQIIKSSADITRLSVINSGGSFFVLAGGGGESLSLRDIMRAASGADKIILENTVLVIDGAAAGGRAMAFNFDPVLEIRGEVFIDLTGTDLYDGMNLLKDISGEGAINIRGAGLSGLYRADAVRVGNSINLQIARETDYEKVFGAGDMRGIFLNNARGASQGLLAAMDSAESESELNQIMQRSVAFNPVNLMLPVKLMSAFWGDEQRVIDEGVGGITAIAGNGLGLYLYEFGAEFSRDDFSFSVSAHTGNFSQTGLEDFAGKIYGGAARAAIKKNYVKASLLIGADYAEFYAPPIYGSDSQNPNGISFRGDFGLSARAYDDGLIYAEPFIRARFFAAKVLYDSEKQFATGAGARLGRRERVAGIATDISMYGIA